MRWFRKYDMLSSRQTNCLVHLLFAIIIALPTVSATAGPAYRKFEECIATCPNDTFGNYACFLRCLLDYGDDKKPSPGMIADPASTGFVQSAQLNGPVLDLVNRNEAVVSVKLLNNCGLTVCPKPQSVEYLLVTSPTSAGGGFGTVIGSSADDSNGYALTYNPQQFGHRFGIIVAQARFSSDPLEDIDDIAAVFFVNAPVSAPTLSVSFLALLAIVLAAGGVLLLRK